jgi:hypothetical protein
MKKKTKKLVLAKETVRKLEDAALREATGAAYSELYFTACYSNCKPCVSP